MIRCFAIGNGRVHWALHKAYERFCAYACPLELKSVVYCSKCGAKNDDDAEHCTQCGATLKVSREKRLERRAEEWGEEFGRRAEAWGRQMEREFEGECFGLPQGGAIVGIILGVIILILGFAWLANIDVWTYLGPLAVIIVGILILVSVVYSVARRR